ncbi:hypothetical protein GCM10009413_01830 [Tatumella punctata]
MNAENLLPAALTTDALRHAEEVTGVEWLFPATDIFFCSQNACLTTVACLLAKGVKRQYQALSPVNCPEQSPVKGEFQMHGSWQGQK